MRNRLLRVVGDVLDSAPLGAIDPLPINEQASVYGHFSFEGLVIELVSEYARHAENLEEERKEFGEKSQRGWVNLYPDTMGP